MAPLPAEELQLVMKFFEKVFPSSQDFHHSSFESLEHNVKHETTDSSNSQRLNSDIRNHQCNDGSTRQNEAEIAHISNNDQVVDNLTGQVLDDEQMRIPDNLESSNSDRGDATNDSNTDIQSDADDEEVPLGRGYPAVEWMRRQVIWWTQLPPPIHPDLMGIENTKPRLSDFSLEEMRLMITYLIHCEMIDDGPTRKPWRQMMFDGYLLNRTVESLYNNFRRKIMPRIEEFKLPKIFEKQFIMVRNSRKRTNKLNNELIF